MYEDCCLLVVCPKLVPFFFLPGDVFSMETEVAGFAAKKKGEKQTPTPMGLHTCSPKLKNLLHGWSKKQCVRSSSQNIARSNKKGHFSEGLGIGTPTCLKNLLVVVLIGCF